jgi:Fic family protein
MPTLQELLLDIDKQKSILDSLRPISSENMLKIRQKFVLEYNYHSNHLEGNSLTIQETYSMLMNSYSPRESKPMRDIDELRGHIKTVDALGLLEDVVKDKKDITESLIRDLNRMILVENFKKRRKDENGDDIFVDIIVGQYKTKPNSVKTQTGEMFRFADPTETAPLVHDLINWYNKQKDTLHPLELAAMFHYKFIRIHPFDDGNGRVARLLMNLILQNNGYPIVIISSEEKPKEEYYKALMDTDANLIDLHDAVHNDDIAPFEPFVSYIGERLLKSLDWTIRGA